MKSKHINIDGEVYHLNGLIALFRLSGRPNQYKLRKWLKQHDNELCRPRSYRFMIILQDIKVECRIHQS